MTFLRVVNDKEEAILDFYIDRMTIQTAKGRWKGQREIKEEGRTDWYAPFELAFSLLTKSNLQFLRILLPLLRCKTLPSRGKK